MTGHSEAKDIRETVCSREGLVRSTALQTS